MNKLSIKRISILFLLIQFAFGQFGSPKWVRDSGKKIQGHYVGFGAVSKKGLTDSEYINLANEAAFLDISNQISVNISGETKTFLSDRDNKFVDEAESFSESSSLAELEGLIRESTYQNQDNYYVLWKLSREEHQKNIIKYARLAENYYNSSMDQIFNPVDELGYLVKGYESILRAHGQIVRVESEDNNEIVLNAYFASRIEELLSKIDIRATNTSQNATFGGAPPAPLIFKASYRMIAVKPLSGLPVKYTVTSGDIVLDENLTTDFEGVCQSRVTKVLSELPNQEIQAIIDLSSFKMNPARNAYLDRKLNEIASRKAAIYRIDVSQMIAEKIAVKIIPQEGLSVGEADFINEKFIAELKKLTDYTVIERALMGEVLEANEFNAENCSTDECQVQIGRILAVRKMIYVLLWKYGDEYNGTVKLVNIESGENEHSESVSFEGGVTSLVRSGVPAWIRSFYSRLNTAKMTFTSQNRAIELVVNGRNWGRLPIFERAVDQGSYKMNFSSPGYESKKQTLRVSLGQQINREIALKPKTRLSAFGRSLIYPGRGQWYSSDRNHTGRRIAGIVYSSTGTLLLAGSLYFFSESSAAAQNYESAKIAYGQSTLLTDIESARVTMRDAHQKSIDARSAALGILGATAGLWLWNAIDAAIFFPNDYDYYTMNPQLQLDGKNTYAGISITKSF